MIGTKRGCYKKWPQNFPIFGCFAKILVRIGNRKNDRNGQNAPKMAKIKKLHYFTKKISFKNIQVDISSF